MKRFWFACFVCFTVAQSFAALSLTSLSHVAVQVGDQPFLQDETLDIAETKIDMFTQGKALQLMPPPGWEGTAISTGGDERLRFYREVAETPNHIELSWYLHVLPYAFGDEAKYPGHDYHLCRAIHRLHIPQDFLEGATYQAALTGSRTGPGKIKEGQFSADLSVGEVLENDLSYLTITTREGRPVTINFNPKGPANPNTFYEAVTWSLERSENGFALVGAMKQMLWGGTRQYKLLLSETPFEYETLHNQNRGDYVFLSPDRQVVFGTKVHRSYTRGGVDPFVAGQGQGWLDPDGLRLGKSAKGQGVFAQHVANATGARKDFAVEIRDGLYLIHLAMAADEEGAFAPVNVLVQNERKIEGWIPEGQSFTAFSTYGWAKDGHILISLEGSDWRLCGLSLSPLIYAEEDYVFSRSYWVNQASFDAWLADLEPVRPIPDYVFAPAVEERMDWAWNVGIERLSGSLSGERTELSDPAAVEQRVQLIRSGGFGAMMIDGLHMRQNFIGTVRDQIMRRNSRLAVDAAHRHGLKVICHHDLNFVYYDGIARMLKIVDKDPIVLQRSVSNPLVTQCNYCLTSPTFLEDCQNYLSGHLRATGVDGYMIDEVTYFRDMNCACDRCRRQFSEDTGFTLPYATSDELGRFFRDSSHPAWRAWTRWRGIGIDRFTSQLIAALRKINPNLFWMGYSSASLSFPMSNSFRMNDSTIHQTDYFGDEFHPDDIIHNWRPAFARLKERRGAFDSFGNYPTWFLAKTGAENIPYLYAWAISRMNRANLRERSEDYPFSARLNGWSGQMKDKDARPLSDVALLLSQSTSDIGSRLVRSADYYHQEHKAWAETLPQVNIQYDIILERDIELGRLDRYRVLLLPNTAALRVSDARAIEQFVAAGGVAITTFETGIFDETGAPREHALLLDAMNLSNPQTWEGPRELQFDDEVAAALGVASVSHESDHRIYTLSDPSRGKVWATVTGPEGERAPAIVETPYEQGRFLFVSANLIRQNFESRMGTVANRTTIAPAGSSYRTHYSPAITRLAEWLVRHALDGQERVRPIRVPEGVIFTAFEEKVDENTNTVLHFVNLQGKPWLEYGEPIVRLYPLPQPPLPHDVEVWVQGRPLPKEAYAVSPLGDEAVPVTVTTEEKGYRLRIPASAIENYTVVHLKH